MSTGAVTASGPGTVAGHASPHGVPGRVGGTTRTESVAHWPLSAHLPLGALPTAVPCARMYTRVVLGEWGLAKAADAAGLVVSELLTNSIRACTDPDGRPRYDDAALPVVHLRLASDRARVLVEVWDSVRHAPVARRAGPDEEGGRGIALVQALSDRWDWATVPGWPGKVVWAELRSPLASGGRGGAGRPGPALPGQVGGDLHDDGPQLVRVVDLLQVEHAARARG
jgi:Histidine kinase-like ATPase domain